MTVYLRPGLPLPGQRLEVEVKLVSESETPLDRVTFDLLGEETVRYGSGNQQYVWRHEHIHQRAEAKGRPLTVGEHTYRATFDLPGDLPARRAGRYASIVYTLGVRADIPWWPDRVGSYDVPIEAIARDAPVKPALFASRLEGALAGEPYVEMSLASSTVETGGTLTGTVAFTNLQKSTGLSIALVAFERLFTPRRGLQRGILETIEVQRWAYPLDVGPVEEGRAYGFQFAIAPGTVPSMDGAISATEWAVQVTQQGLISRKTLLHAPITIVPATGRAAAAPQATPAVGLERRAQIFQHVAALHGLAYDAVNGGIAGVVAGVTLRVGPETRPSGAREIVAHLAWPSLGIALRVEEGSLLGSLLSREIDVDHAAFDRRFQVRCRFAEQAKAIFDAETCEVLTTFPEVAIGDEGALLAVPIMLTDEEPLADFVKRARTAAERLGEAFARVPPPPPLASAVESWRGLAERLSGRFEIGSGSIREGTLGPERVEIVTEWSDDAQIAGATVIVPLGVRIDAQAISPSAQARRDALAKQTGGDVAIEDERVVLRLHEGLGDPLAFEPTLDSLARLVQAVRGHGGASPFR